jgi:CheY-like chemotaxis protein
MQMHELLACVSDYMEKIGELEKKKNLLIVDDDVAYMRMVRGWLKDDYQVAMANSGMQAITWMAKNPVDLILLDYEMPVMNGPEVLKEIRNTQAIKHLPVIFLTAKDDKESVMKVVSLKPEKYLLKSMPKEKLTGAIDEFFNQKAKKANT